MISVWLFMGPPGCGKGTQASLLKSKLSNVNHLSTGDLLRSEIKSNSSLGVTVKSFVEAGKLVPDELILDIFSKTISEYASDSIVILDGFPRTTNQAESLLSECLKRNIVLEGALWFNVSNSVILNRTVSRRVCSDCGEIYNISSKVPAVGMICDKCGGDVVHRKDDTFDIVSDRLATYEKDTEPLKKLFLSKNLLINIDAHEDSNLVQQQILRILKKQ